MIHFHDGYVWHCMAHIRTVLILYVYTYRIHLVEKSYHFSAVGMFVLETSS